LQRPDLCDGTYPQYCDAAPQYQNITDILAAAGQMDLLNFMNTFWLPDRGTAEHFWEHEWNKHGTCINTLSPGCYGDDYQSGDEVVDFFSRAVAVFKVCSQSQLSSQRSPSSDYSFTVLIDGIEADSS
jgi:ribonuclease T2